MSAHRDVTQRLLETTSGESYPELADAAVRARYHRGRQIGRGGMGEVASARDLLVGRPVAVKSLVGSPEVCRDAFVREARIQGRLDHPSIVPVYDLALAEDGRPYFTMRRLDGTTLAEILDGLNAGVRELRRRFPRERLLRIFMDVCHAVQHAHERGVIHRDLKPGNVMIDGHDRTYVIDWGIAWCTGDPPLRDGEPQAMGTPAYMSREQVLGRADIDVRADVYALGCILFEILAGTSLHPHGQRAFRSVMDGADPRPSRRAPTAGIPAALDEACARAAAPGRDQRFATARELADAIQAHLDADADAEVRRAAAATHLADARRAASAEPPQLDVALRAAGRVLALDPGNRDAADLASSVLATARLEDVPGAAAASARADRAAERSLARTAAVSYAGFAIFLVLVAAQHAAAWYVAATAAVSAGLVAVALAAATRERPRHWLWWSLAGHVAAMALLSRFLGPFLLVPGLSVLVVAAAMLHPRLTRPGVVIGLMCLAPTAPWLLERAGLLEPTTRFEDGRIIFSSAVSELDPQLVIASLLVFTLAQIVIAALVGQQVAQPAHRARRELAVQQWWMEHLLPGGRRP